MNYNGEYGFDMTFNTTGLLDIDTYFDRNVSDSCKSYAHKLANGKCQVFLVQVLTGEIHDYKEKLDSSVSRPPKKNESLSNVRLQ